MDHQQVQADLCPAPPTGLLTTWGPLREGFPEHLRSHHEPVPGAASVLIFGLCPQVRTQSPEVPWNLLGGQEPVSSWMGLSLKSPRHGY